MQLNHSTELLVVTLVHTLPDRDTDTLAHIRFIGDMLRNAAGLVSSAFYHSREQQPYYLLLTTWEDEESWQQARERYNPTALLLTHSDFLAALPEQWYMYYRWGYNRPARSQTVATTHIARVRASTFEVTHMAWLQELRKQAAQFTFTSGFLAYGIADTHIEHTTANAVTETLSGDLIEEGHVLLTFISWPSDTARMAFYQSTAYQNMNNAMLAQQSGSYMLTLDPL